MQAWSSLSTLALRLSPGDDVRRDLATIAEREQIRAGIILGAVGSLSTVVLRLAGAESHIRIDEKHEILILSGTVGTGGVHLHMTVANQTGQCLGGHVVVGCKVYTTLELVIGVLPDVEFDRVIDAATGFAELQISTISRSSAQDKTWAEAAEINFATESSSPNGLV